MSIFADDLYDDMGWLGQAIQPYSWTPLSMVLALPEKIDIDPDLVIKTIHPDVIDLIFKKDIYSIEVPRDAVAIVMKEIYSFTDDKEQVYSRLNKPTITYERKLFGPFDDNFIKQLFNKVIESMWISVGNTPGLKDRLVEQFSIMELPTPLGKSKLIDHYRICIKGLLTSHCWNVRNLDILQKLLSWSILHLETGNLAALANISKLKCMTHSGRPIYSMKEII